MQEEGVKLLGVLIDENLDWKLHINHVKKKIGKGNYLLWRHKKKLTINMKKSIYECFVRCHLSYCLVVWGAKKSNHKNELIKILKRIWTKIGQRYIHTNERLKEHGILKLEDELKLKEIKLIWKWEKKEIPHGLLNIITENRTRQLRQRQFQRNQNWKQTSIAYRLATRAIKEIDEISCARSLNGLKNKYKKIITQTYSGDCRIRNCFICARTQR